MKDESGKDLLWLGPDISCLLGPIEAVFAGSTVIVESADISPAKGYWIIKNRHTDRSETFKVMAVSQVEGGGAASARYFQLRVSAIAPDIPPELAKHVPRVGAEPFGLSQLIGNKFGIDAQGLLRDIAGEQTPTSRAAQPSHPARKPWTDQLVEMLSRVEADIAALDADQDSKLRSIAKVKALREDVLFVELINRP